VLQTLFDPIFISFYNLFYTAMPVMSLGVFDQDVNDKNSLSYPKLYTPGHQDLLFNKKEFLKSAMHGFFTSCILFLVPYGKKNINLKIAFFHFESKYFDFSNSI
jgi:phospholipid-translocating ATPase